MAPYRGRQFGAFGERSVVHRPLWVFGPQHMAIGVDVLVLRPWLSVEWGAWGAPAPVLSIGDRTQIGHHVTLSAHEHIAIEEDVTIGAYGSIVDANHTYSQGRPNVMSNPSESAPIHIGRGTWLAHRVAVTAGAHIGRCCIIGANSVVRGPIPDFAVAAGVPARVVGEVPQKAELAEQLAGAGITFPRAN